MSLFDVVAPFVVLGCGIVAVVLLVGTVVFYAWEERRERRGRRAVSSPVDGFRDWRHDWEWSE